MSAVRWVQTTDEQRWVERDDAVAGRADEPHGVRLTGERQQTLRGFGGCFNELGWVPLQGLSDAARAEVVRDLFSPSECDLGFNRSPVGANDFATAWYSYDETPGDLALEHFSVERDEEAVLPFIRAAQAHQPEMQLFSSPWSPPTWMKNPPVYNHGRLVMTPENLDAYARYFVKFVQAYADKGVRVDQIHVQNEVFADQKFPSCVFDAEQLRVFIRDHLGPRFEAAGLDTRIFLGTLNGPEDMAWTMGFGQALTNYNGYVDHILLDDEARKYIAGVGYQWAGQHAIARTHEAWPELELVQTESECGMGHNDWAHAEYVFHLMQHYFRHGSTGYTYWNMVLAPGGLSTWGWRQNSMFTVDAAAGTVVRNPEYYVMRHHSHFVRRGARRLALRGHVDSMVSAFENPDGGIVVVAQNALDRDLPFSCEVPEAPQRSFGATLAPHSFNTFVV